MPWPAPHHTVLVTLQTVEGYVVMLSCQPRLSSLTSPTVPEKTGLPCSTGAASLGDRGSAGSLTSGGLPVCTSYIFGDDQ